MIPHSAKPPHTAHEPTAARINRQKTNSWRLCLSSSAAIAPAQNPFMRVRQRAGRKVSMWEVFNDTLPNWAKEMLNQNWIGHSIPGSMKTDSRSILDIIGQLRGTNTLNGHLETHKSWLSSPRSLMLIPSSSLVGSVSQKVKHDHGRKNWTSQLMYSSASIKYRLSHSQHTKSVATVYFWSISIVEKTGFSWGENLFCVIIQKDEIGWQRQATEKCSTTPKNDTRNIQKQNWRNTELSSLPLK